MLVLQSMWASVKFHNEKSAETFFSKLYKPFIQALPRTLTIDDRVATMGVLFVLQFEMFLSCGRFRAMPSPVFSID